MSVCFLYKVMVYVYKKIVKFHKIFCLDTLPRAGTARRMGGGVHGAFAAAPSPNNLRHLFSQ